MRQHDHAVAGQVHVCLDGVGAGRHGAVEPGHGILRERRLVAPVADVLGQTRARVRARVRGGAAG